tara:strand:+ start:467 stop:577 length:111 start_codon:yes stop_codon:yes gene_type:complete
MTALLLGSIGVLLAGAGVLLWGAAAIVGHFWNWPRR